MVAEPPDVIWPPLVAAAAAPWPLAVAPETLALSSDAAQRYQPGSSLALAPPDADRLRELRRRFFAGGPFYDDYYYDYGTDCWRSERVHTPAGLRWRNVWTCSY